MCLDVAHNTCWAPPSFLVTSGECPALLLQEVECIQCNTSLVEALQGMPAADLTRSMWATLAEAVNGQEQSKKRCAALAKRIDRLSAQLAVGCLLLHLYHMAIASACHPLHTDKPADRLGVPGSIIRYWRFCQHVRVSAVVLTSVMHLCCSRTAEDQGRPAGTGVLQLGMVTVCVCMCMWADASQIPAHSSRATTDSRWYRDVATSGTIHLVGDGHVSGMHKGGGIGVICQAKGASHVRQTLPWGPQGRRQLDE